MRLEFNEVSKLTRREAEYREKVFSSNLMIGTEIEIMFENHKDTDDVRRMVDVLNPGGNPGNFISPIQYVTSDGSLENGAEIITTGRRVYGFMEQFSMYQSIYNCLKEEDPIISPRMGWHNHIVLQNYNGVKANEMPIPKIIFDNLMKLCSIYYPALAFMSSTMPHNDCYTRYSHFCIHDNLADYSWRKSLGRIMSIFDNRYNAVNINPIVYRYDEINEFHVEFRFPDGSLFPIQMASLNILFKALVMKAVNLSKFGNIENNPNTDLYKFKNDGRREERLSNPVPTETLNSIKDLAKDLVSLLKPEILKIDKLAVPFIEDLATSPISVMFKELGVTDLRIVNDTLEERLDSLYQRESKSVLPLIEVIETGQIRNVLSKTDWFNKASELVSFKEPLEDIIVEIGREKEIAFNNELGFYFK